jgi:hypothetical protein
MRSDDKSSAQSARRVPKYFGLLSFPKMWLVVSGDMENEELRFRRPRLGKGRIASCDINHFSVDKKRLSKKAETTP